MTTTPTRHLATAVLITLLAFASNAVAQTIVRGPYLQMGTADSVVIRWRTDQPTDSVVNYGTSLASQNESAINNDSTTEHEVQVIGLTANTEYFYSVGSSSGILAGGDDSYRFVAAPTAGSNKTTRVWVLGDSGTANSDAEDVRDAFHDFTGARRPDIWLMLGDNAYDDGRDSEYQAAVFDMYPETLRQAVLWSTIGNHDGISADSSTESGPYYDIFTFPVNGEAGGLASGTEAYYSFDYGNIHFISLDSHETDRSPNGAMLRWLENDLATSSRNWLIAFWHHPPYTKGSHDSDSESRLIEMRQNVVPILERYGVDMVLSGHSHSYERSYLIDGHYDVSNSFDQSMKVDGGSGRENESGVYEKSVNGASNLGAVYAVAGSSGRIGGGRLDHPAMYLSLDSLGSMVLDVNGDRLDAFFIDSSGATRDYFSITKGSDSTPPTLLSVDASDDTTVVAMFSENLDSSTAELPSNYSISNGVSISSASLGADDRTVTLGTSPIESNVSHTLIINNVEDTAGNAVADNSQQDFLLEATEPPDITPPRLLSVAASDENTVELTFSESLARNSAEQAANYSIDNGVTVNSVELIRNQNKVMLSVSSIQPDLQHTVSVDDVRDEAGNAVTPGTQGNFLVEGPPPPTLPPITPPTDSEAPTTPRNMRAINVGETFATLAWDQSSDNVAVVEYRIFRDNSVVATTSGTGFNDDTLLQGTAYRYSISAVDAAGNESAESSPLLVVTEKAAEDAGSENVADTTTASGSADLLSILLLVVITAFRHTDFRSFLFRRRGHHLVLAAILAAAPGTALSDQDLHLRLEGLNQAISAEPENYLLYMQRSKVLLAHKDYDAALADISTAADKGPTDFRQAADLMRSDTLLAAGRGNLALPIVDRFVKSRPKHVGGRLLRAQIHESLGHIEAAVWDYSVAIELQPRPNPDLYLTRASLLVSKDPGRYEESLQGVDSGIAKLGPLVSLVEFSIDMESQRGNYDRALRRMDSLPDLLIQQPRWLTRRAELLHHSGQIAAAAIAFDKAMAAIAALPDKRRYVEGNRALEASIISSMAALVGTDLPPHN